MDETRDEHAHPPTEHPPAEPGTASGTGTTMMQPVAEPERILAIDVLRGFALLGIFMVNMQLFARPIGRAMQDPALAGAPAADVASWFFVRAFCEYKFISLFSLLFGIGIVVQMTRAEAKRRDFTPYFLRRTLLLGLIGLLHAILLWYGDILFIYACLSIVLFLMRRLSPRALLTVAACLVVAGVVLSTSCLSLSVLGMQYQAAQEAAAMTDAPAADDVAAPAVETDEPRRGLDAIVAAQFDPTRDVWVEGERLAYREGPLSEALVYRAVTFGLALVSAVFTYGWHVLVMFLLGAALMKLDFFAPERRRWHVRFLLIGGLVGLPLECLGAAIVIMSDFDPGWMHLAVNAMHEVGSYALCLGYVGGVTLLVAGGGLTWLMRTFASLGRTALSNYILQTVIATSLMYWWGLGLFDEVTRTQMIGLVAGIYAAQLALSRAWLAVFTIGPLEWLWRSLTYLKPQPMLRR